MDWTVYWFMLPVCTIIATIAMFSGISGAALLTPTFLIGFPLFGVPRLTLVAAIGTSLFLEGSGFGTGVYRYLRMRLVDTQTAKALIVVTLPLGVAGAILARFAPAEMLRLGYGVAMLALAWLLLQDDTRGGDRTKAQRRSWCASRNTPTPSVERASIGPSAPRMDTCTATACTGWVSSGSSPGPAPSWRG